jgi:dipeptidyl-peptidase-4
MKFIKIIPVFLLLITSSLCAQKQELTLDKAVFGGAEMRPQSLKSLSFFPIGNAVVYWKDNDFVKALIKDKGKTEKNVVLFTLDDLNRQLKNDGFEELKSTPQITFITENTVKLEINKNIFIYNIDEHMLQLIFAIPDDAENVDFYSDLSKYAFTRGNNLYIIDKIGEHIVTNNLDMNIVSGQAIARFEFGILKGTFWSPDGNMLSFYQKDESDVTEYSLQDISTKPATTNMIKYPMAGQKSEKPMVGVYNIKTRKTIWLKTIGAADHYLTNLTWGTNNRYIYLTELNRDQDHLKLNKYTVHNGELIEPLFEEQDEKYIQPEHDLYFIPKHDDEFLFYSERDGFNHLYKYNTSGKLLAQITKGDWLVDELIGFDHKGDFVFVTGWEADKIDRNIYRIDLENGEKIKLNNDVGIHNAVLSPNGKYLIDIYSNLDTPKNYLVIDATGEIEYTLFESPDPLKNYEVSKPEIGTLYAEDGTLLYYRMIKPTDFDASKKYPVLVYVYNGPNVQLITNRWNAGASLWMNYFAEQGYIVFTVDGRGSNNRGLEFEQSVFRQLGQLEMRDQLSGVEYLKSKPWIDADRMAIHGWSYGGFMTLSMMINYPDVFKVGVAGGPVTDWALYEVMYGERYMDSPETNPDGYAKTRVYDKTENITGKVLVIHGAIDPTVVPQHSHLFLQDCVNKGIQVDFFTYPGYEHNVRGKDRVHLMRKVLDYIEDNLN